MSTDRKKKKSPSYFLVPAAISLVVGIIVISGLVMKNDVTGRVIVGALWFLVAAGWLGRFFSARRVLDSTDRS